MTLKKQIKQALAGNNPEADCENIAIKFTQGILKWIRQDGL